MTNKDTTTKSKLLIGIIIILLILLAFTGYRLYYHLGVKGDDTLPKEDKITLTYDDFGSEGNLEGKSKDEIVAALNEKVADGMINISMNTNPIFASGKSAGTLMIANSEANRYPQQIEIYRADTGDLIYTGAVKVGHKVETSYLSVDLPKGDYDCIAYFHAVNPDTGIRVGTAGAHIKITILS